MSARLDTNAGVAEWKFERGGWLQVYQLKERAGRRRRAVPLRSERLLDNAILIGDSLI